MLNFSHYWQTVNRHFGFQAHLALVPDTRKRPHYSVKQILTVLAVSLAWGARSQLQMERWLSRTPALRAYCGLRGKTPTADTLVNVADKLEARALHQQLGFLWHRLHQMKALPKEGVWLAVDGTGMSPGRKRPAGPVMGVVASVVGTVLQGAVGLARRPGTVGKETGELTAAHKLLEVIATEAAFLPIQGVITDALYTNRPWFEAVRGKGWHFICRLRNEQLLVFRDARGLFESSLAPPWKKRVVHFDTQWFLWEWQETDGFEAFADFPEPVRVIRLRQTKISKRGQALSASEELWVVTSLPSSALGARKVLELMRSRWDIEVGTFRNVKRVWNLEVIATTHGAACEVFWLMALMIQLLMMWYLYRHLHRFDPELWTLQEILEEFYATGTRALSRTG